MPIIPITERTPEERREIARKGGLASVEARRKKKARKQATIEDLSLLYDDMLALCICFDDILNYSDESERNYEARSRLRGLRARILERSSNITQRLIK